MKNKITRLLKIVSMVLVLTLGPAQIIQAADVPVLVYNDVDQPTLNHKVSYKGSEIERPKYYDNERNAQYISSLTSTDSTTDHTYERQHIQADDNGLLDSDALSKLDTTKVYMDYVHHMYDGDKKTVPLSVFGNDEISYTVNNIYNTYPAREVGKEEVEEEEDEESLDLDNENEVEETTNTGASIDVPYASELNDRRGNVSMNIYPDRKEVTEGGEYECTDSQVVYKIYKALDPTKIELVTFDNSIDVVNESLNESDPAMHVDCERAISANEDGYTTMLGNVTVTNTDSKYNPASYWKVYVPSTSIHDTTSLLDWARYIKTHYGDKLLYGSDYFVYEDPGETDISYEDSLSEYYNSITEVDTVSSSKVTYENSKAQVLAMADALEEIYPGTKTKILDRGLGSKTEIVDSNLTFTAIPSKSATAPAKKNFTLNKATNATRDVDTKYNGAAPIDATTSQNLLDYSQEISDYQNSITNLSTGIADIIEDNTKKASRQTAEDVFLLYSNCVTEITEAEYNLHSYPGEYIKYTHKDYSNVENACKQVQDDVLEAVNDTTSTCVEATGVLDQAASMYDTWYTTIDDYNENYADAANSEEGLSENEISALRKELNNDLCDSIVDYNKDVDEINTSLHDIDVNNISISGFDPSTFTPVVTTTYYRVSPYTDYYTLLMQYCKDSETTGYEGEVAEFLENSFGDVVIHKTEDSPIRVLNTDLIGKYITYGTGNNKKLLNTKPVSQWQTSYTDASKFDLVKLVKPKATPRKALYIRQSAVPKIKYVYDGILLSTFNESKVQGWEENGQKATYAVLPLGNDSLDFQYTALAAELSVPTDDAEYFGIKFKFKRNVDGINRYYSRTYDGINKEDSSQVTNITNDDKFVPEVGGFIGVSYYGYFDKFHTNLSLALEEDNQSFITYESPVKLGSDLLERVLYQRNIVEGQDFNPDWYDKTYRNPDLYDTAPHIIWYEVRDTGIFNLGFRNFQCVGSTDTLLVTYTDPSRRNSYMSSEYTRGPDTFVMDLGKVNAEYDKSSKWPTPKSLGFDFDLKKEYEKVADDIQANDSVGTLLQLGREKLTETQSQYTDDYLITLMSQMKSYKFNIDTYRETVTSNYKNKRGRKNGVDGLCGMDYDEMSITDQTLAPYTYESDSQRITLTRLDNVKINVNNDLYFMLDTYGTDIRATRYIRIKRDAEIGSSGYQAKDASGNLSETIPEIYQLFLTERVDDKYTHEFTNNMLADLDTSTQIISKDGSLRTLSIVPGVKYIPEVTIDDVTYDYYELSYSIPQYGTWRATEYLDEDGKLHLIEEYQHPAEGTTKTIWQSNANTYMVHPLTVHNQNSQHISYYELGYGCLNPFDLYGQPDPTNKLVKVNTKDASVRNQNKGTDKQCGDWAFISTDPYLWTAYNNVNMDKNGLDRTYESYVNLYGEIDEQTSTYSATEMSSFSTPFATAGYTYEHKVTTLQQGEKHPAMRDDSGFFKETRYQSNMTIAVTTSETLTSELSKEDVYIEFNNSGATHNVEARYAQFILQTLSKAYLPSNDPLWNRSAESLSEEEINKLILEPNYEIKADIHNEMELLSLEEKRTLVKLYQKLRNTKISAARDNSFYDILIKYTQGVGPSYCLNTNDKTPVVSGAEAKKSYPLLVHMAQYYLQTKVTVRKDTGVTDRLANNIIFVSNVYPSLIYRVKNIRIQLASMADSPLYQSIESGKESQIYTFADSKRIQDYSKVTYSPGLIVWYAKVSPLLPSVAVNTPVTSQPIQPVILGVDEEFIPEVAMNYQYIIGVRITAPGTYSIYDADANGNDIKFTVTSSGIIFNTYYGPFDPANPEAYLNQGTNDNSVVKRVTENNYMTEFNTEEMVVNGERIPADRYIYYVIANVSEYEASKIAGQIQLTYDNKEMGTIRMDDYTEGNKQGIYIFYHKIQCPGRYFLVDTSKTITILGTQPTLVYGKYTGTNKDYTLTEVKEKLTIDEEKAKEYNIGVKEVEYYQRDSNCTLFAYYKYNPGIEIEVSYPGYSGKLYAKQFMLDGKLVYGFWIPNPEGDTPSTTSSYELDGEFKIGNTSILITTSLESNLYVGYPMFSDKQLLQRVGNDDDPDSPPANASTLRNVNWFPGLHLFWIDNVNANYQILCKEYWHKDKPVYLTDTTFEMKATEKEGTTYLHRMLIPYPGEFTVISKTEEAPEDEKSKWSVIVSPPKNFYIGSTTLKQNDDTLTHMAKSYNYRPSQDHANNHIRVLYLACEDYLIPAYYSALLHEHDWNIKASWLNQDIGLYKTGLYRDNGSHSDAEAEYFTKKDGTFLETGKVFYAFDERIIKQHDAELERYESKLPSFHPLYAEIIMPTLEAPYTGGYGLQLLYHNSINRDHLKDALVSAGKLPKRLPDNQYTEAQLQTILKYENYLKNYLGYITPNSSSTVKIEGVTFNISDISKDYATKSAGDLVLTDEDQRTNDYYGKIPNELYPYEKQANGFYYANNIAAYADIGWTPGSGANDGNPTTGAVSKRERFGNKTVPSDSSRLTMPTNPWAGSKLEPNPSDGLNGFYYTAYRAKSQANLLTNETENKAEPGQNYFLTIDPITGIAKKSETDVLGNRFYDSDVYHVLSWWSNAKVTSDTLYRSLNGTDVTMTQNADGTYSLNAATMDGKNKITDTSSSSSHAYGRAIPTNLEEYKQSFKYYNKRFWSPFDDGSGLTNYDIQGYFTFAGKTRSDVVNAAKPYKPTPDKNDEHKIICHPIYEYETKRLTKYQHDMILPADFSGQLKLPSYITDIDTAVINTFEDHDNHTYTGGYYTYTLYIAGQTGLVVQANHTGEFIVDPKKSQHLKVRQTSPWGSYAEYDLNLIFTSHLQKDSSIAQLDKNIVDLTMSVEDVTNPYHLDQSTSYKMTIQEETMSAGEYVPQVIVDKEADAPIYSQMLVVYMLYQDVPSYRYDDTGHMWMYDWFRRDGFHMNNWGTMAMTDYAKAFPKDTRYKDRVKAGIKASEIVEGFTTDHIQKGGYEKLLGAGVLEWQPAQFYDEGTDADGTATFLRDGLLEYTQNMNFEQPTNDIQNLYKTVKYNAATQKYDVVPYTYSTDNKSMTDTRSRQNMRTFVRFIDALHDDSNSKYKLKANPDGANQLLRNTSYSYLGAYPNCTETRDLQLNRTSPWFFATDFDGEKTYQSENMSVLLNRYKAGNLEVKNNMHNGSYAGWSNLFNAAGGGPLNYPNRDWHHYYPIIPENYEVPEGNITQDYMKMTQILHSPLGTPQGDLASWFGKALSDLLGRTIFTLERKDNDVEGSQDSLDMFNYLGTRTSLHVHSYQDCVNAIVYDSEAYNIMQSEIKPIIDLDNIQKSDIDSDSNFWVKSLQDTFVNR